MENLPVKEVDNEHAKTVFSKYYEYLPYKRRHKESVVNVLHSRETGLTNTRNPLRANWSSSYIRKSQAFYTRSLCAAKFGSCVQPHRYPISDQTTKEVDEKRLRPRQFEYHPSDSSLMAVGTLDGEVIVLNHETGKVLNYVSRCEQINGIIGLCWLKQPSKLLVGSDDGSLRLYDMSRCLKDGYSNSSVIFDDFKQLTSVHVNSTDDICLTSGYSKKVAIYDICSGQQLQLFPDLHSEPINVAKFANHSPNLFVTSSFDREVKIWDLREKPLRPCYTASSSRGNVMVCFSTDDLYFLVSAVDNEDMGIESSIFVQSLRSDPFRHFQMAVVLAVYVRPTSKYEIIKVNLLSSRNFDEDNCGGLNSCLFPMAREANIFM